MRKTDYTFKYLGNCSICGSAFQPRGAHVISTKKDITHIYAKCADCKSSVVVYVLKSKMGFITTIGMLTDMTLEDIKRFRNSKPITADDVLELHKLLENK